MVGRDDRREVNVVSKYAIITNEDECRKGHLRVAHTRTRIRRISVMIMMLATMAVAGIFSVSADAADRGQWTETVGGITYTYEVTSEGAVIKRVETNGVTECVLPSSFTASGSSVEVTAFTSDAFAGNTDIKKVTLNVQKVPAMAFDGCTSLEEIDFGEMESLEKGVGHTPALSKVTVSDSNTKFFVKDGVLFEQPYGDQSHLVDLALYPSGRVGASYRIGEYVYVEEGAFCDPADLKTIIFEGSPNGHKNAFIDCEGITTVELGGSANENWMGVMGLCPKQFKALPGNKHMVSVGGVAYSWSEYGEYGSGGEYINKKELHAYPAGKTDTEFAVPDGTKVIGANAFCGSRLERIALPQSLVRVGAAFDDCERLKELVIPNNVSRLDWSFQGCSSLEYVTVPPHTKEIMLSNGEINRNVTIRGEAGSYAEQWAGENGIPFEPVDIALHSQQVKVPYRGKTLTMTYGDNAVSLDVEAMTTLDCSISDSSVAEVKAYPSEKRNYYGEYLQDHITVRPLKAGTAVITLRAEGTDAFEPAEAKIKLVVRKKAQTVKVPKRKWTGVCGKSAKIGADASTKLSYKSSDTSIVKVSASGTMKYLKPGRAVITIRAAEGTNIASAEKKITVRTHLARPKVSATVSKGKIKLHFSRVYGAKQVQIYVKYPGRKKYTKVMTRNASLKSVVHKGLKKGKVYRYMVRVRTKVHGKYVYSGFSKVRKIRAR